MKAKKGRSPRRLEGFTDRDEAAPDPSVAEVLAEELEEHDVRHCSRRARHPGLDPKLTAGDVDADLEDAAFTGEETPGGGTPTPDQDRVDDIGEAIGVEYQDNEPLRPAEKIERRDVRRWELDPASSEDYPARVHPPPERARTTRKTRTVRGASPSLVPPTPGGRAQKRK
jgi:hypothetical protein